MDALSYQTADADSLTFRAKNADFSPKDEEAYGRAVFKDDPLSLDCFLMFLRLSPKGRGEALEKLLSLMTEPDELAA